MTWKCTFCHCEHLTGFSGGMQKKIGKECHCEGAAGDCGNLNPHNTKTLYFLRRSVALKVRQGGTKQSRLFQQARKRESSFFALDPCFRRGDIVSFCLPQQILNTQVDWLLSCHAERKKPLALSLCPRCEVEGEASGLRTGFLPLASVRFFAEFILEQSEGLRMTSCVCSCQSHTYVKVSQVE